MTSAREGGVIEAGGGPGPGPDRRAERDQMVDRQIACRGVLDPRVLAAMRRVPREAFVPASAAAAAYEDRALLIGDGQTISQPYVVAIMAAAVALRPGDRVLEIGTGSGYGAAVLSRIASAVYTVERIGRLARMAAHRLRELGYDNVHVLEGDGTLGWPAHAPYDGIVVTAAGPRVPPALLEQLSIGGRLVMPVGESAHSQRLVLVTRTSATEDDRRTLDAVSFVPLIGREGWPDEPETADAGCIGFPESPESAPDAERGVRSRRASQPEPPSGRTP